MEDKILNIGDAIASTKRIEFLLEQVLIHTAAIRYKDLPEEERKTKVKDSLQYVDDDMKVYIESLKNAK